MNANKAPIPVITRAAVLVLVEVRHLDMLVNSHFRVTVKRVAGRIAPVGRSPARGG